MHIFAFHKKEIWIYTENAKWKAFRIFKKQFKFQISEEEKNWIILFTNLYTQMYSKLIKVKCVFGYQHFAFLAVAIARCLADRGVSKLTIQIN